MSLLCQFEPHSVAYMLIQVTVIVTIAIWIALLFRRSAAVKNCILLSAFVCTFAAPAAWLFCGLNGWSVEIPIRLFSRPPVMEASFVTPPSPVIAADAEVAETQISDLLVNKPTKTIDPTAKMSFSLATSGNESLLAAPDVDTPSTRAETLLLVLGSIWLSGVLFALGGIANSWFRIRRLLETVEIIDAARFSRAIAEAARNLRISKMPRIGVARRVSTPAAVGAFCNPWILIPRSHLLKMTHDQLVHVLTHEGAHVVRRDPFVQLVQRVNMALWWWHPLVYLLNRHWSRAREELCDNVVLNSTNAAEYGETLLELAKMTSLRKHSSLAISFFGSRWKLEHRIEGLLNPRRHKMIQLNKTMSTLVLALFIGGTIFANATRLSAQESDESRERREAELREREIHEHHELLRHQEETVAREREIEDAHGEHEIEVQQQLEHLHAAHAHLREAGMEQLANAVARQAERIEKGIPKHADPRTDRRESERFELENRDRQRVREMEIREQQRIQERRKERLEVENRDRQRVREMEIRERAAGDQEFREEIIGTIRELSAVVRQLKQDVEQLKERGREE